MSLDFPTWKVISAWDFCISGVGSARQSRGNRQKVCPLSVLTGASAGGRLLLLTSIRVTDCVYDWWRWADPSYRLRLCQKWPEKWLESVINSHSFTFAARVHICSPRYLRLLLNPKLGRGGGRAGQGHCGAWYRCDWPRAVLQ